MTDFGSAMQQRREQTGPCGDNARALAGNLSKKAAHERAQECEARILAALADGQWRTFEELCEAIGGMRGRYLRCALNRLVLRRRVKTRGLPKTDAEEFAAGRPKRR